VTGIARHEIPVADETKKLVMDSVAGVEGAKYASRKDTTVERICNCKDE
jgi:hypothetical protein